MSVKSKIFKSTLTILVMFIALVLYGSYDSRKAHETEKQFCASVNVGMPIAGLQEKAIALGADKRMTRFFEGGKKEHLLMVTFTGIFIFERYICELTVMDEKVTTVTQAHIN
jgi:NDP-sugar pyrophosphorylase family protein